MMGLEKLTPAELKEMALGIAEVSNRYQSIEGGECKLSLVEFSGSKSTGVEAFASDMDGNGLLTVKVTLNKPAPVQKLMAEA